MRINLYQHKLKLNTSFKNVTILALKILGIYIKLLSDISKTNRGLKKITMIV